VTAAAKPIAQPAPPADEAERQARLDRMKRLATGLLLGAVVIFAIARAFESRYPWLAAVRATAEAAMIGGLADWFAVTALFRHPMGIPIPHTAIIPARKDQVGRSLGGFVQRNFLTREVIAAKLGQAKVAEHLATWLADPDNARTLARRAAVALSSAAHALRDEDVQAMIDRTVAERVRKTQVAPLLGKALTVVTAGNRHQDLLDGAITLTARMVTEHRGAIREKIGDETPWWVPGVVDEKIYKKVVASIEQTLQDVRDDAEHPLRERFDDVLHDFIVKLQTSPQVIERAEQLKEEMLNADVVRRFSGSLWSDAKAAILRYAEDPNAFAPGTIERMLNSFGDAVLADPALIAKVDAAVTDIALYLVGRYQDEVGALIAGTVSGWDPQVTSRRIELAIGKDLQFIRINGTLVGGLAGLVIWAVGKVLS
jgi:uncharacterized membrane-anchored protein YjiN (DUF445 family)